MKHPPPPRNEKPPSTGPIVEGGKATVRCFYKASKKANPVRFGKLKLARDSKCYPLREKLLRMQGNAYSGPFVGWWRACKW